MFTGIITDIGVISAREEHIGEVGFRITTSYDTNSIANGASIACDGVCLTVTETGENWFTIHASAETLAKTTMGEWQQNSKVNLERPLCVGDELGGHLVSGHVDCVGRIISITSMDESHIIAVEIPSDINKFIASKGSVTINGISLTVNAVNNNIFEVNIIPHTWQNTTCSLLRADSEVNIEIDLLARYTARILETANNSEKTA